MKTNQLNGKSFENSRNNLHNNVRKVVGNGEKGGVHATSDDFFKSVKFPVCEAEIKALGGKKVGRALLKKIEEEGQAILALGKTTSALLNPKLGSLLLWYTKGENGAQVLKAANLIKWNTIVAEGTQPPLLESWITENEAYLESLKKKDINMGDTEYSRMVAFNNKEMTAALGKSTKKERDEWRAKIDLMDASLVGDNVEIYLVDTSNVGKDGDEGAE